MTTRSSVRSVVCVLLALAGAACARKSSGFPLDVRTVGELTPDNTAQISFVESGDDILVTIVDKSGDGHLHKMNLERTPRNEALEMLRDKQKELDEHNRPAAVDMSPFKSVVVSNGTIVVALAAHTRLFIQTEPGKPRLLEPGESLSLQPGIPMRLFERHISFDVTAQLELPAGVQVRRTDSHLDENATKEFFVQAK